MIRAKEEYFKIMLGPLLRLPEPIPAGRWRRVTFLYTTGEYLLRARKIADLVVRSEERVVLWRSLRERALIGGRYQAQDLPEFPIDPLVLEMLGALTLKVGEGPGDGDDDRGH